MCTERFSADFGVEEWFDFNVFLRDGNDRDFLAAGLVDHMHIVVIPILLGRGVRLWDGLEGLENDYEIEAPPPPAESNI